MRIPERGGVAASFAYGVPVHAFNRLYGIVRPCPELVPLSPQLAYHQVFARNAKEVQALETGGLRTSRLHSLRSRQPRADGTVLSEAATRPRCADRAQTAVPRETPPPASREWVPGWQRARAARYPPRPFLSAAVRVSSCPLLCPDLRFREAADQGAFCGEQVRGQPSHGDSGSAAAATCVCGGSPRSRRGRSPHPRWCRRRLPPRGCASAPRRPPPRWRRER